MNDLQENGTSTHSECAADIVIFCDESGAKGYADQSEQIAGETGVFAGYVVRRSDLATVEGELQAALSEFHKEKQKLHIADLSPEEQGVLRERVYDVLGRLPCFYEAIHVEGFHASYERIRGAVAKAAELAKASASSTHSEIKVSKRGVEPRSLHVELFLGLYTRILTFCLDQGKTDLKIEIRTDRIDGPILEKFHKEVARFWGDKVTVEVTGWNLRTESVVKGSFSLTLRGKPSPFLIQECLIRPGVSDDNLVVAADVLANSLNHLFCERGPEQRCRPLNCNDAISRHSLFASLSSFRRGSSWDFSDSFYAHPKNSTLMESKQYSLSTIVAVVLSKPREGEKLLKWTEVNLVGGEASVWFSDDEMFRIVRTEDAYPFRLEVKVLGDKYCGVGPFHSFAAATEAAERIWAGLLEGKIHYTQISGSGFVAVVSRVLFPNL
jgi:hypothetical protein